MKPAIFDYRVPESVEDALRILAEVGDEGKVLAGGQSLVPSMNFRLARPSTLVDINPLTELDYVRKSEGHLAIGTLCRHSRFTEPVTDGPLGRVLEITARLIGHHPIRVRGTFGGSIAHADPAAEWCLLSVLLDADIVVESVRGSRVIPAGEFFRSVFTTALDPDELLLEVRLPIPPKETRMGFAEFSRRAGDFALVAVGVSVEFDADRVVAARIAMGGVGVKPVRAAEAEGCLIDRSWSETVAGAAADRAAEEIDPLGDIHGSRDYRRHLVRTLTYRALKAMVA